MIKSCKSEISKMHAFLPIFVTDISHAVGRNVTFLCQQFWKWKICIYCPLIKLSNSHCEKKKNTSHFGYNNILYRQTSFPRYKSRVRINIIYTTLISSNCQPPGQENKMNFKMSKPNQTHACILYIHSVGLCASK